jgi:TolB-like protein
LSLFNELKRRNVFKVGVAYAVTAWILLQLVDVVGDILALPEWAPKLILLLLVIGFVPAVIFAWAFELTPEGVKREKDVDRSQSITPKTGKKLNNAILGLMALAVVYLLFDKFSEDNEPGSELISQPSTENTASVEEKTTPAPIETEPVISKQSIAVLPFDNRSNREEDQFFTDGIHDDLLTTIARIGSMKVISRTSVMEYRNTTKKLPEIARELGVANILEGGIQRSGNQVRINVQLIDANTDEHLWAEIFDRELTANNLFAIQSEISKSIAEALHATLSPEEEQRIDTRPTDNLAAYDAYLRGRQLMATRNSKALESAARAFQKAVDLDPEFALAWVGLADTYNLLPIYGTSSRQGSIPIRANAVERALSINDQLGEAYTSLASLRQDQERYEEATKAYKKAIELSPNYATAWHWYSTLLTQFPLRRNESLRVAERAAELDPKSSIIGSMLAGNYADNGLYTLAENQYLKVIELDPDFAQAYRNLSGFYRRAFGRYDKALEMAIQAARLDSGSMSPLLMQSFIYRELNDGVSMQEVLDRMVELDPERTTTALTTVDNSLREGNRAGTRETIKWALTKVEDITFLSHVVARFALANRDFELSKSIYLAANPGWKNPDEWDDLASMFPFSACLVGWVFKQTGDEQLGAGILQSATRVHDELLPSVMEHAHTWSPELCYLANGDTGKALDSLESQLADNHLDGWHTWHRLGPYDQIRDDPRYQAMADRREQIVAGQIEAIEAIKSGASL